MFGACWAASVVCCSRREEAVSRETGLANQLLAFSPSCGVVESRRRVGRGRAVLGAVELVSVIGAVPGREGGVVVTVGRSSRSWRIASCWGRPHLGRPPGRCARPRAERSRVDVGAPAHLAAPMPAPTSTGMRCGMDGHPHVHIAIRLRSKPWAAVRRPGSVGAAIQGTAGHCLGGPPDQQHVPLAPSGDPARAWTPRLEHLGAPVAGRSVLPRPRLRVHESVERSAQTLGAGRRAESGGAQPSTQLPGAALGRPPDRTRTPLPQPGSRRARACSPRTLFTSPADNADVA